LVIAYDFHESQLQMWLECFHNNFICIVQEWNWAPISQHLFISRFMQKGDLPLCDLFWEPSCFHGIIDHVEVICSNYLFEAHIEIHHNILKSRSFVLGHGVCCLMEFSKVINVTLKEILFFATKKLMTKCYKRLIIDYSSRILFQIQNVKLCSHILVDNDVVTEKMISFFHYKFSSIWHPWLMTKWCVITCIMWS